MVIKIAHLLISATLIALILIQAKGGGLGGILGQQTSLPQHQKKGFDKILFIATIGLAVLFLAGAVINTLIAGSK
jgi:protein translocase SecG subunit